LAKTKRCSKDAAENNKEKKEKEKKEKEKKEKGKNTSGKKRKKGMIRLSKMCIS